MKKAIETSIFILIALVLVGCNKKNNIVISKLYTDKTLKNSVIELYNNSDKKIDLKGYKINIYINGEEENIKTLDLTGYIEKYSYYSISGNEFDYSNINEIIDYIHDEHLSINGNDPISLNYLNKKIDVLGYIGHDINYSSNITLIRLGNKEDYYPTINYDEFKYIKYVDNEFKFLKNDNFEIKTLSMLLKGPKLENNYIDAEYSHAGIGTGGIAKTNHIKNSNIDGDTANFQTMNGYDGGSLRYYYINTPEKESPYTKAEPFGYVATKYNQEYLLKDSNNVILQSIPTISTKDTYDRNLGLVWVDNELSQFKIVLQGLSFVYSRTYNQEDLLLTYKDIPYLTFLLFAEEESRKNGWGLHGELSPDWDYNSDELKTKNPDWIPHELTGDR